MRVHRFVLPLLLAAAPLVPSPAFAQIGIGVSVTLAPPVLPVYEQPEVPGPGYIWTPGYWAWGDDGYYWVPGTWVQPPSVGLLWTPGYWGSSDGGYVWNAGYWGAQIGFYGGINYGCGYFGHGYDGGYWNHGAFYYNRSVNNIRNVNITNVYNRTVINNNTTINRVSFNGGNGGITARPSVQELAAAHEQHVPPTALQQQHINAARANPELRLAQNHGAPLVAATRAPGQFTGAGVVPARSQAAATAARSGGAPGAGTVNTEREQGSGFASHTASADPAAEARAGAPGPAIGRRQAPGSLPALRNPGSNPPSVAREGASGEAIGQQHGPGSLPNLRSPGSNPATEAHAGAVGPVEHSLHLPEGNLAAATHAGAAGPEHILHAPAGDPAIAGHAGSPGPNFGQNHAPGPVAQAHTAAAMPVARPAPLPQVQHAPAVAARPAFHPPQQAYHAPAPQRQVTAAASAPHAAPAPARPAPSHQAAARAQDTRHL